jgi:ATP/maltotriose-dependent transcriptional regulator MalT
MSANLLLVGLLIADVILCLAIIILIVIVNREIKKRRGGPDENSLMEFRNLLNESQVATNHLLEVMNDSRKALKEIAYILDEKEGKLRALVEESRIEYEKLVAAVTHADKDKLDKRYEGVIAMVKQGLSKKEICQKLELTEGEIDLIIELDSTRHKPQI